MNWQLNMEKRKKDKKVKMIFKIQKRKNQKEIQWMKKLKMKLIEKMKKIKI